MKIARVTVGNEGEITLPPEVCERLGVGEGDEVEFVLDDEGVHLRAIQQEPKPFVSGLSIYEDAPQDEDFNPERLRGKLRDIDL